jgi:cytochrome c6
VVAVFTLSCLGGCLKKTDVPSPVPIPSPSDQQVRNQTGEALFRRFCSNCHPDGGNVSDPDKALHGYSQRKNHITQPEDIVRIMRNPKSRMMRFDDKTISDRDAHVLAEYIFTTYK